LAHFKIELDETEPGDSTQYGPNATGKKVSVVKAVQSAKEKKKKFLAMIVQDQWRIYLETLIMKTCSHAVSLWGCARICVQVYP